MTTYLHHIETLVPPYAYTQDYACERMLQWMPEKRSQRLVRKIYGRTGIDTRYSVVPDFVPDASPVLFVENAEGRIVSPTTGPRNRLYSEWARKLSVDVCRRAFENVEAFCPEDVTHVITVSCTGFSNPGPDLHIVQALQIPDSVERYHLGFMGCYAAFPALRMARQFCMARPDAVVLVLCLELCSLHLQVSVEPDNLLANALFGDGVAAALVSAKPPAASRSALALHTFSSALAPEGAGDMAWSIGDHGFDIHLSAYVPKIIAANIAAIVEGILAPSPWIRDDIGVWAVHPGGRAILDKIEKELGLFPDQMADSRAVLREFGNMSSATILFVLQRILERSPEADPRPLCAMAFGPGLTIESALLEHIPQRQTARVTRARPQETSTNV